MKCDEFELTLAELSRGAAMAKIEREHALRHARHCPSCGEFASASELITGWLGILQAEDAGKAAPPTVEATLLAAFRDDKRPAGSAAAGSVRALGAHGWSGFSHRDSLRNRAQLLNISWLSNRSAQGLIAAGIAAILVGGIYISLRFERRAPETSRVAIQTATGGPVRPAPPNRLGSNVDQGTQVSRWTGVPSAPNRGESGSVAVRVPARR
ncbi:MAG TPA: hypothetical protein VJX67_21365, partial [Blastocatellia bacterium]|nr:hypothetical protein [Blastocatellia bacterium]